MNRQSINRDYLGLTPDPALATREALSVARDGRIPIVEVFYSLQGEGLRSGQATVFVRLAGCNCDCWFCDTDFRIREAYAPERLIAAIREVGGDCRWVCLTGGEPTIHDLADLCEELRGSGYRLQIETNGSRPVADWRLDHVTVSPKLREGARLDPWFVEHATEFKHIVADREDIERALELASRHDRPVFLQPNSHEPASAQMCIDAIKAQPDRLRLSPQVHKLLAIP